MQLNFKSILEDNSMVIMLINKLKFSFISKYIRSSLFIISIFSLYLLLSTQTFAACTTTGSTQMTYEYNAANIQSPASLTFTGTWLCRGNNNRPQNTGISRNICSKVIFDGRTSSSNGNYLNYEVSNLNIGGLQQSKISSNTWYGPAITSASNNVLSYSITVTVPSNFNQLTAANSGTYTGSLRLYMDMQDFNAPCEGDSGGGWDSDNKYLTFNYVIPAICQFHSTDSVNFGIISDIGTTKQNYDAEGAIYTTCSNGTPYSIYLNDGNNRVQNNYRQMTSNGHFLAYQLYQDSSRTQVWESINNKQNSSEYTRNGTGLRQKLPVYGRIPMGINVPIPGSYSDTVIVNIVY
jgi:spore coat protein U-like protein